MFGHGLWTICLAGAGAAAPLPITPLVVEGDVVPGVGLVTRIDKVATSDGGAWLVEADTDHASPFADTVVLGPAGLHLREGQALAAPAGSSLDAFASVALNGNGDDLWIFTLSGVPFGEDAGLYFGSDLLIQAGDVSAAPQFTFPTPYVGFAHAKLNDANVALVMAAVDDPALPSTQDRALMLIGYDPDSGAITESVVLKEGDVPPGQVDPVGTFQTDPHTFDLNGRGDMIYTVDLDGPSTTDTVVYLNGTTIAQEGSPTPIGLAWGPLTQLTRTALSAGGSWAMLGRVGTGSTHDDMLLIRDGAKFMQEGDEPPGIDGGFVITSFGLGPIDMNAAGEILWYAEWDDPDTDRNAGLFLEHELLVRIGESTVEGTVISAIATNQYTYQLRDDGRALIFEATLADGRAGAFLAHLGPACSADVDGSGDVGASDLMLVLAAWGACGLCPEDVDGDGAVGYADLLAVLSAWGACP